MTLLPARRLSNRHNEEKSKVIKKRLILTMNIAIIVVFVLGYLAIAFEHPLKVNKAASALVTGVICWTIYVLGQGDTETVVHHLMEHLGEISGILFFLLGAMTIVELIDAHDAFEVITSRITTNNIGRLMVVISLLTFFLSAVLDNLTTTIVMVSLIRKLIVKKDERLFFVGIIVVAANAGGAWSPIGDVTTTMLWIRNQISPLGVVKNLILPSLVCLAVPLGIVYYLLKGDLTQPEQKPPHSKTTTQLERRTVFILGLLALLAVPVFKTVTHLPPFMGMMLSLGILWIATEFIHSGKSTADKDFLSVVYALRKVDSPSILFFLGILLSVAALQSAGHLLVLAQWLEKTIGNQTVIILAIGLLSSVVDNVPLVAAVQNMYTLEQYPMDHYFWQFLAYAAGTGGSALIIGSAAGVAAMGIEKINFFWYLKRISLLAVIGYFAGAAVYILQYRLLG
jgi:Na+/H+ antiporter NhaD/arsenite permease-like protein